LRADEHEGADVRLQRRECVELRVIEDVDPAMVVAAGGVSCHAPLKQI